MDYLHKNTNRNDEPSKYLRENNESFKSLILRADNDGWIEFKKEAKLKRTGAPPNTFFEDYGNSIGLGKEYDFRL